MSHLPKARRTALLGTTLAVATLATAVPGAVATASTQKVSNPPVKLTLNYLDRNQGYLKLANVPANLTNIPGQNGVQANVFHNRTKMQPYLTGTESAVMESGPSGSGSVNLNNLARGVVYSISVKFADPDTGDIKTSNTVTFTTPASTDTQPPTTPTNLKFVSAFDRPDERALTWTLSTDNAGPEIEYVLRRNGQNIGNSTGEYVKGDVFTITAIDSSNNASAPATITYDGK